MPDLRTEMLKTIQVWNKDDMNNKELSFGEQVFNWIKAHPHSSITEARKAFPKYNDSVLSTTLKTLYDRGILGRKEVTNSSYKGFGRKTFFQYFVVHDKYETLKKGYWKPKDTVVKVSTSNASVKAKTPTLREDIFLKPKVFNAEEVVQSLNLYQAKEVYQLLRAVFESKL